MAMEDIHFKVNGIDQRILCPPDRSLLAVLREDLGLTGAKRGCSQGHCGSCAVLVDGKVVLACRRPIIKVRGAEVLTIEGLGTVRRPHPLQTAFAATGAIQCGFCTPGIIIRAKALLDAEPSPDRRLIAKTLRPHLCRCTGYQKIVDAVELGAAMLRGGPSPSCCSGGPTPWAGRWCGATPWPRPPAPWSMPPTCRFPAVCTSRSCAAPTTARASFRWMPAGPWPPPAWWMCSPPPTCKAVTFSKWPATTSPCCARTGYASWETRWPWWRPRAGTRPPRPWT